MDREQLIADIKAMSVLELCELVKALEEEFGVSAAAGVAGGGQHGVLDTRHGELLEGVVGH